MTTLPIDPALLARVSISGDFPMPCSSVSDYRAPKKQWRYPGVPIPERLRHKYATHPVDPHKH